MNADMERLRELVSRACVDSLEAPLDRVIQWPKGDEITDLYQEIAHVLGLIEGQLDGGDPISTHPGVPS